MDLTFKKVKNNFPNMKCISYRRIQFFQRIPLLTVKVPISIVML